MEFSVKDTRIGVIGLGYVGLPLAAEFGKQYPTVGFDIDESRIRDLQSGSDRTLEIERQDLAAARHLTFTAAIKDLAACNVLIVCVPTPVDSHKRPDLTLLLRASAMAGEVARSGDVVIFESTVYPGATEDECIPVIEKVSGLKFNEDFFAGYSPERINPGDKEHRLTTIKKVTSGSTPDTADFVDELYSSIIPAGTFKAPSIRVAEAAKVIENIQRDLNIALINELAIIFNKLNIDTRDVLDAAGTKWNFLPFRPGLVGGHCVGVDPYYLTHKAQSVGYNPEVILSGRRINDGMGAYVAAQLVKAMIKKRIQVESARILVMGLTFKENCSDLRNTRVVDVITELRGFNAQVDVYDPWVDAHEAQREYAIAPVSAPQTGAYDAIILAVSHETFKGLGAEKIRQFGKVPHVLYDLMHILPKDSSDLRL
jgi:UDP-N-acetyl-D-galactosamine dehydrogenase